jgi:hypothetical protein
MQTSNRWSRIEEPFGRTLARNVTIAILVGAVLALLRHDFKGFLPVVLLALWPSLGGHYVELAFVNVIRARIPRGRWTQAVVRLLVWFMGGVLLYGCMVPTAQALPINALPLRFWWIGGLCFVGVELAVHAILAIRGQSSFYDGCG